MKRTTLLAAALLAAQLVLLTPRPACAWQGTEHMIIARIAWEELDPQVRQLVLKWVEIAENPQTHVKTNKRNNTWLTAACYLDDVRKGRGRSSGWHYINLPYKPDKQDGVRTLPPARSNIVSVLETNRPTLNRAGATEADRAGALRILMHLVGDIHQPLHCVALFSRQHDTGDRGGNNYNVQGIRGPRANSRHGSGFKTTFAHNLHALWDTAVAGLPNIPRPVSPAGIDFIDKEAASIVAQFPRSALPELTSHTTFHSWAEEGLDLAPQIYSVRQGARPDAQYIREGQKICRRRLALAGYRLADLLNAISRR